MRSDHRTGRRIGIPLVIGTFPPPPRFRGVAIGGPGASANAVEVAFVNNMPDAAFAETERQFVRLLGAASGDLPVVVRRYSIPGVERGPAVRRRIRSSYGSLDGLLTTSPAGCIVTGTEPRAADLTEERSWDSLVALFRWAADRGVGLWLSCLAAHAALLASDGIRREPLPRKYSGVFRHDVVGSHPLIRDVEAGSETGNGVMVPHSRLNTVPDDVLRARGYDVLLTSADVGWTLAVKQVAASSFVLVQGHPEYSTTSLLREYRRDVRRYLRGARPDYPDMPTGYLDARGAALAAGFQAAVTGPATVTDCSAGQSVMPPAVASIFQPPRPDARARTGLVPAFPYEQMARRIVNTWQAAGVTQLANWMSEIAAGDQKDQKRTPDAAGSFAVSAGGTVPGTHVAGQGGASRA